MIFKTEEKVKTLTPNEETSQRVLLLLLLLLFTKKVITQPAAYTSKDPKGQERFYSVCLRCTQDMGPASEACKCHDVPNVTMYPRVSRETGV